MPTLSKDHIHEYSRAKNNRDNFRCVHPDCTHYWDRFNLEGKRALCTQCKNPFVLTSTQLRNANPRCDFCSTSKKGEMARESKAAVEELLNDNPSFGELE